MRTRNEPTATFAAPKERPPKEGSSPIPKAVSRFKDWWASQERPLSGDRPFRGNQGGSFGGGGATGSWDEPGSFSGTVYYGAADDWSHPCWRLYQCPSGLNGGIELGWKSDSHPTVSRVGPGGGTWPDAFSLGAGTQDCDPATPGVGLGGPFHATPELALQEALTDFGMNPIGLNRIGKADGAATHGYAYESHHLLAGCSDHGEPWTGGSSALFPLHPPLSSDRPGDFPIGQPMHWPTPGKGEKEKKERDDGLPLVPFPIALVPIGVPFFPPVVTVVPGQAPRWRRNDAARKRPDRRTRERKLNVRNVGGKFWMMLNVATEMNDFIEAMGEGLPKECKPKPIGGDPNKRGKIGKVPPHLILQAIWKCWDHWDANKAFAAFVTNQIEDMFYGTIGKAKGRGLNRIGVSTDVGGAVKGGLKHLGKAGEDGPQKLEDLPLPVVKYEDGKYVVEIPIVGTVDLE